MIFDTYEPREVLKNFEKISKIPRGSGNEKAISDFIADFARDLNMKVYQDKWHNLIIQKPASPGYEKKAPVVLQAHLDMVCEKNADTEHDFTTDPIDIYVDGDLIKARGTTLGADNGIGVSIGMALLEGDYAHPPLEIVFTTEEESGMGGAENLSISHITGLQMFNLDTADDTTFIMGCAAGSMVEFDIPTQRIEVAEGQTICKIMVKGLKGGHSGSDINKERGNANQILGLLLSSVSSAVEMNLSSISGGMKINAIPREAQAVITFSALNVNKAIVTLEKARKELAAVYQITDPELSISWDFDIYTGIEDEKLTALSALSGQKVISSLLLMPSGVRAMSTELSGVVASSCNLGVVETHDGFIRILAMPRSASEPYSHHMECVIGSLAKLVGATVIFSQRSPAWAFNSNSPLLKTASEAYRDVFDCEPNVVAIHAGLECGLFANRLPGLDIISFGPNTYDMHTPDERVEISSVGRVWTFIKTALAAL